MYVLRIEHRVRDYQGWKQAFDSDPPAVNSRECCGIACCALSTTPST